MNDVKKKLRGAVLALCLLSVVAASLLWLRAQRSPVQPSSKAAVQRPEETGPEVYPEFMFPEGAVAGVIEGRVLDERGQPVGGALVSIAPRLIGTKGYRNWSKQNDLITVTTNSEGHYRAEARPGILSVVATARGFLPERRQPVKLLPQQSLARIDFTLTAGGVRLHGTVSDTGGGAIAGARIMAAGFAPAKGEDDTTEGGNSPFIVQATADEQGNYEIFVAPLHYDVITSAEGYATDDTWLDLHAQVRHDVKLHPAAHIRGVVWDAEKKPVPGAAVKIYSASANPPLETVTDENGRYTSDGLDPGRYTVQARLGALVASTKEPVSVALAAQVDVDLTMGLGFVVSGRVTDMQGKPIEGATLAPDFSYFPTSAKPVVEATSGKDGRYTLRGLVGQVVNVKVEAAGFGSQTWSDLRMVGDRENVDFKLTAEANLVVFASGPDKQPLPGVVVYLELEAEGANGRPAFENPDKATGADGKLRLRGLSPGKGTLFASSMDHGSRRVGNILVQAGSEITVPVRFDSTGTISGTVKWEDGSPAEGVVVNAWGDQGGNETTTGKAGHFVIKDLAVGSYTLLAHKQKATFNRKPDAKSMAIIQLEANEKHEGVSLILPQEDESIEGIVVGTDGRPAVAAQVGVTPNRRIKFGGACDGAYGSKVITDHEGRFKIEGVARGVHGLCATQAGSPDTTVGDVPAGAKNVRLKLMAPAQIRGVVVDSAGKPVSACAVAATFRAPEEMNDQLAPWKGKPVFTEVSPSGTFTISGLPAGIWDIKATTPDGKEGLTRHIDLREGAQVNGVQVQIRQGVKVSGRLVNAETKAPLAGVNVSGWKTAASATTDKEGRFTLASVPAGMKVDLFFKPTTDTIMPEAMEVWVPESGTSFDIGTFTLSPTKSVDEDWGKQVASAAAGLRVGNQGGHAVVTGIFENSPGASSGVNVQDRVLAIEGKPIDDMGPNAISRLLTGQEGESVTVRVQTGDAPPREVKIALQKF